MIKSVLNSVTDSQAGKTGQTALVEYVNNPKNFDRKLEERSYLRFEFYESSKDAPNVRYLMFYENPEIRESRKAMHAKYQPISRNSTLLAYTGAESRQFSLSFKITLPHILSTADTILSTNHSNLKSKEEMKNLFFKSLYVNDTTKHFKSGRGNAKDHDLYFRDLDQDFDGTTTSRVGVTGTFVASRRTSIQNNPRPEINRGIDLVMYWTNLIRLSVLNNAKNPTNGPPIIRLNHGILYQDIPCVALDYKIDYDKAHGADLRTLLPRVISFEINLQEIRVGDFGDYNINKYVQRDNSVGWEVILNGSNTIDPIRPDIGIQNNNYRN
jgi:hypothetical protein